MGVVRAEPTFWHILDILVKIQHFIKEDSFNNFFLNHCGKNFHILDKTSYLTSRI